MLSTTLRLYKNAYAGLSKESWLLGFVVLVNRCGTMVLPFLSIYCTKQLGFSLSNAGIVIGVFGLGAIVGSQLSGKLIDKIGFYKIQIASLFFGGLMFFVVVQLKDFYWLCASVFVLSFFNESFRPANATAVVHYSKPENITRSYAINRLAINLGFAVGGALGGWLATFNYHLLFYVDGITNILAAFLLLKLLPDVASHSTTVKDKKNDATDSPYKDKVFMRFILLSFFFAVCFLQLFSMQPIFLKDSWHFSEFEIGTLMALNGIIIVVIEMVLIHSIEGKKSALFFIRVGMFILVAGFGLYILKSAHYVIGVLSMILITVGEIFCLPFFNTFWTKRTNPNNRGRYAALYTTAWSAAQVMAPTLGAVIAANFGYSVLWMGITITLLCLVIFTWLLEKLSVA